MTDVNTFELRKETIKMIREDIESSADVPDSCTALDNLSFFVTGPQLENQLYLGHEGYSEEVSAAEIPDPEERTLNNFSLRTSRSSKCFYYTIHINGVPRRRRICF